MAGANRALAASPSSRQGVSPLTGFDHGYSAIEMLVDDVTGICQRVPFIEVAPAKLFDASLLSELADASDRLAAKVGDLQERQGASR